MNIAFKNTLSLHCNPKARLENNDCTVHAIANAWGIKYNEAHAYAKQYFKRSSKAGASIYYILESLGGLKSQRKFPVINGHTMEFKGAAPESIHWAHFIGVDKMLVNKRYPKGRNSEGERVYGAYTIGKFINDHPIGRFFILVRGHA